MPEDAVARCNATYAMVEHSVQQLVVGTVGAHVPIAAALAAQREAEAALARKISELVATQGLLVAAQRSLADEAAVIERERLELQYEVARRTAAHQAGLATSAHANAQAAKFQAHRLETAHQHAALQAEVFAEQAEQHARQMAAASEHPVSTAPIIKTIIIVSTLPWSLGCAEGESLYRDRGERKKQLRQNAPLPRFSLPTSHPRPFPRLCQHSY